MNTAGENGGRAQRQVRRQWRLVSRLAALKYGVTLQDAAGAMGVTVRTIRRDLDVLVDAGFPIEKNHGDEGIAVRFVWGGEIGIAARRILTADPEATKGQDAATP